MRRLGVVMVFGIDLMACGGSSPPPRPPVAAEAPEPSSNKVRDRDIVQPVKIEKQEAPAPIETGEPTGVVGGPEGGVVGGDLTGVVAAPPPPPPPPPTPPNIAPTALDAHRIAGEKNIIPDDETKNAIYQSGKEKLIGSYKLCVTAEGAVNAVTQLKSTGFPAYDNKIISTIRGEWRYRPFIVNGKATPVCTAITFIYSQVYTMPPTRSAPPAPPSPPLPPPPS